MMRPDRTEYERAVALALAAIRATEAQRKGNRSGQRFAVKPPEVVMRELVAKAKRGALSCTEQAALAVAWDKLDARRQGPKKRGPKKGSGDWTAKEAIRVADMALEIDGRLSLYGNEDGRNTETRAHAIADAMRAAGFHTHCTLSAVKSAMKAIRRPGLRRRVAFGARTPLSLGHIFCAGKAPLTREQLRATRQFLGAIFLK